MKKTTSDEETTTVVTGNGDLAVSLSPSTPASATIPGAVNGIEVAAFDFTAGSEDVTVTQITVKRRGLSDEKTITGLAAFTDLGRASNSKNDNQENDTEAQLNLSDGGVVVKAGETRTVTIVADLGAATDAANDEFALELVDVVANASVDMDSSVSNTMRIGSVDAPTIVFNSGSSVSNPTLGEQDADLFEFEIDGDNNEDVILKSITFEGSNNSEDNLVNFKLYKGNDLVAETTSMNDDYLTFDLGEGVVVEEDKNEDFLVTADIVEGAGDTVSFNIDESLDVTAESTKFGYGAAVNITAVDASGDLGTVTLEAGELTIIEIEPEYDEIREDKNNVVIGGFELNNVAGENLELQQFGVRVDIALGTSTGTIASEFFDDVELYNEDNGSSYELTINGTDDDDVVYSDNSIDVVIPQGKTTWFIRVDTAESIVNFDTVSFDVSFTTGTISGTTGGFYVEETEDNTQVTDITPSSVSFNTLDGSESGATASLVPLSDITVVRGADDLVVLQFEIEAEESSDIIIDEIVATVVADTAFGAANLPSTSISAAKLFVGSVSDSNEIDQESGSNIANDGTISFNDFDEITIAANDTETFIVTLSIVDGADAVTNTDYNTTLTSVSAEDDDNDDVTIAAGLLSAREVTVTGFGVLSITADANNDDNQDAKTILAGENAAVFSVDVQATNESMDVETVVFKVDTDLTSIITNASLYLDDVLIDTNSNSNVTATGITFDNLNDLIIEEATSELVLVVNTETIGFQKVGSTATGITVTNVDLEDVTGASSGKDAANQTIAVTSEEFTVAPATVTTTVETEFSSSNTTAIFDITTTTGDNTQAGSNSTPVVVITDLLFSESGNIAATAYTLKDSDGNTLVAGVLNGSDVHFTGLSIAEADMDGLQIEATTATEDDTYGLSLKKEGVTYTVDGGTPIVSNSASTVSFVD